jgi:hypothetical protein
MDTAQIAFGFVSNLLNYIGLNQCNGLFPSIEITVAAFYG